MGRRLAKLKESLKHKHQWQEDQWGKRCEVCGHVRTKRGEVLDARLGDFVHWLIWVLAISFAISGLVMQMTYPINEQVMERITIAMGDSIPTFLFLFLAGALITLTYMFPEKEEKKT